MSERARIIIVDDEVQMLLAMETVLIRLGHEVRKCNSAAQALELLALGEVDLLISDLKMPEVTGIELLSRCAKLYPRLPVVIITAYGTIGQAVEAMKNGAFDFITKPFSAEDLEAVVARVINPPKINPKKGSLIEDHTREVAIISKDPSLRRVLEIATTVARSRASVLIQGESGTGKELIAKLIHTSSDRADGPFVAVNCAALPGSLLESELFGHEKGAFTGAISSKMGKFECANGGTILLDEISEMEAVLQAKLLRILQEREVDRVGGQKPIPVDVRVIATTNRDIRQSIRKGEFREDLYYRLNVIPLFVPPLRERRGDIPLLVEHFIRKYSKSSPRKVSKALTEKLEKYHWPGNVRELQNACERAVLLSFGNELEAEHFFVGSIPSPQAAGDEELHLQSGMSVAEAEKKLILETLRANGNNRTKAAELLGISIRTLRNKLHEYGESSKDSGID
ncbi:MAG: sigma-54-dependent Fis family transcriptional regulator [Deltaproteobacteria bacterium]|nr:sigma-54-dependent Fis family transcriptional regulator [Deltaproteobacteria bacterium]